MMRAGRVLAVLVAIALAGIAHADVTLPGLFTDHAIVQRYMPVPVWGTAAPGESVEVSFNGQTVSTIADGDGNWMVTLAPMPASTSPLAMTVTGNNVLQVQHVQIGEVWLGSGQSNMNRTISTDAERDIAIADAPGLNLAFFNVASGSPAGTIWQDSNEVTADTMSAVMFWFGRRLAQELPDIPVGLIHSSVSATAIERWSTAAGSGGLYREQIVPLQPYALQGALWYQGEWDTRNIKDAGNYYWQLPALIDEWRADWGQGDFPFYVVQMPRMGLSQVHVVRDAELQTAIDKPGVEITVNLDYPEIDVHPSRKEPFGRRLADIALKNVHLQPLQAFGPVYDAVQSFVAGNEVYVSFDHLGGGLVSGGGALAEWEIAGPDGNYVDADAVIVGDHVVVSGSGVSNPASVRYAFAPAPANPNLFNSAGLPASPIRELILTSEPDTAPPTPDPMTWDSVPAATSDTVITMSATTATDASGVEYFFECTSTGCADSGWQDSASYTDTGLQADTTYAYRVQARDKSVSQNATGFSSTESAPTLAACVASGVHVTAIVVSSENVGQGWKQGKAEVTVGDDCGNPAPLANVSGTFSGDFSENASGNADASGVAVLATQASLKGKISFQFCVTGIAASLPYVPADNVEVCSSL